MTIFSPVSLYICGDTKTSSFKKLESLLSPQEQSTLRALTHVLRAPIDAPRIADVLLGASQCIDAFGKTLIAPTAEFNKLLSDIEHLSKLALSTISANSDHELDQPLQRRLLKYAAWAICMRLAKKTVDKIFLEAIGMEIALSFASGKVFPNGYGNDLRRALDNEPLFRGSDFQKTTTSDLFVFSKHFNKGLRNARLLFEDVTSHNNLFETIPKETFETKATQYLLRNQTYAPPNHRRAVLDFRCQSKHQVIQSAQELRSKATCDDETAIVVILAFIAGISPELILQMPLAMHAQDDWLMTIDIDTGIIKTNIDPLFPKSATPSSIGSASHHPANKIIVKPIPAFLQAALIEKLSSTPSAKVMGDIFTAANTSGKLLTSGFIASQGIASSARRLLNSAAPFAVQLGINRLVAAMITNDFSIIPGSKPYYSLVSREEIWSSCSTLFGSIGWGSPTPLEDGLPIGSLVAATPVAVAALFEWMGQEVSNSLPSKRYTLLSLIEHHNVFSMYCSSLTILCLGSRQAKQLRFSANGLHEESAFTPVFDKRTGQFPGALPVPINTVLSEQLGFWRAHCSALDNRLEKIGLDENTWLRNHIRQVINCSNVHLFFGISTNGKPFPLGSSDLTEWWPNRLQLNANFSRSFWQHQLHLYGLKSSIIDLFVRHQLIGAESHTSTTHFALTNYFGEIVQAQEKILYDMNITSLSGLAKK
ncbi:MAG: hypothetical protein WC742_04765 [Gallionellaceae bacterium]|jgi:hypothetical protein